MLRPSIAAQLLVATTAMPPSGLNITGLVGGGISTTFSTPGTFRVSLASYDANLPSMTGQRSTDAYFMPGRRMSIVYLAAPTMMFGRSTIGTSLPM